jgi:hypothetical protein
VKTITPDHILKRNREWYRRNKEYNKERNLARYERSGAAQKEKQKEDRKTNPIKYLLIAIKARCKKNGTPFSITAEDLILPTHCPILNIELQVGGKLRDNSPSVDKIIPSLGYIPGNVAIISMKANRMKSDSSVEDLRKIISYIEDRQIPLR